MSPRRQPGQTPKHDWPLVVAAEVIRRLGREEGTLPPSNDPTLQETIGYEPDDSDMRKLLKFLRGDMISYPPIFPDLSIFSHCRESYLRV